MDNATIYQGNTRVFKPQFKNGTQTIDISAYTVKLFIKRYMDDDTGQVLLTNTPGNHGAQEATGISLFTLTSANSQGLTPGLWYVQGIATSPNSQDDLDTKIAKLEVLPSADS